MQLTSHQSKRAGLLLVLCAVFAPFGLAGCTVGDGSGFDASFFEDAGTDASRPDAASNGEDAGADDDSGSITPGSDASMMSDVDAGATSAPGAAMFFAKAICAAYLDCWGGSNQLLLNAFNGSDCVSFITRSQSERELHWLDASIAAGRVAYHADNLEQCATDIKKLGCDFPSRRLPSSCEEAFKGKVVAGDACAIDYDCEGTEYCDHTGSSSCGGVCTTLKKAGSTCAGSTECFDGLTCPGSTGTCTAPVVEGDACDTVKCPPGLVCQGKTDPTCVAADKVYIGAVGDDCNAFGDLCQPDLVCASVSGAAGAAGDGKCAARAANGGACTRSKPSQCPADQVCNATAAGGAGKCVDLPGDGLPCMNGLCAADNACFDEGGAGLNCRAYTMSGSSCADDGQCYSNMCGSSGECITLAECTL